ncbi:glycosyltransferase family 39 protein [Pedobacter sp. L105]|uniref:ArnT family glycosyltransferase n=1 Tax=Pedobacter sp. L105 TaxID=1641871 RepID=UPI00131CED15|nr:glycosyltransferase family 39 protein [Pedobacter sp. L105]
MKNIKSTTLIILSFCVIELILHLFADYISGFHSDELLHIATGNHPAIGYMEFPPMIGWMAWVQNQYGSTSVFIHHIFTHVATVLILILIGLTTIELGGKSKAVFIALLCIVISPGFDRSHQLFQPVVFSEFFWVLSFYLLVRFVKKQDNQNLFYLTLALAFGFLTKYDIVFLIAGICSLFFLKNMQKLLLSNQIWKFILLFVVIIAPNLWWQYAHDFPMFQMFSRLYETQLDKLSIGGVFSLLIIDLNPVTFFIWLPGLFFMFNRESKALYLPLAICIALTILLLALAKSKHYYFFSAVIFLIIFGSIWFEQRILIWQKWLLYPVSALFILTGLFLLPWGLMVLPLNTFIGVYKLNKGEHKFGIPDEYYAKGKWDKTMTAIKTVYDSLPAKERQECLIWGKHYSQAGAVNLLGGTYGLPKAFSYHGSFYLWAPGGQMPETVIAFTNGEATIDFFDNYFNSVVAVKKVYNSYSDFEEDNYQTIYICKKPKQSFDALKMLFKKRVFE